MPPASRDYRVAEHQLAQRQVVQDQLPQDQAREQPRPQAPREARLTHKVRPPEVLLPDRGAAERERALEERMAKEPSAE